MNTIDLAIITPTLNEEKYIGILLDSIARQSVLPREIVIVDANSQDETIEEIKKRQEILPQLTFYQIPKYTISRQRNFGAKKISANHILFLDADVELKDPRVLADYWKIIQEKNLDVAMAPNIPLSDSLRDKLLYKLAEAIMAFFSNSKIWPMAVGTNLYFKRVIFEKLEGFDEEVRVAEDFELVQRATRKGDKYLVLTHPKIHSSVRRLRKEGRLGFFFKLGKSGLMIRKYGFRGNPITYEFGDHEV